MGLISDREQDRHTDIFAQISSLMRDAVDIEAVLQIAFSAPLLQGVFVPDLPVSPVTSTVKIGVACDRAFCFYFTDAVDRHGYYVV